MQNQWNQRYAANEYIYGEEANEFFKEMIDKLTPGSILIPCEGEGRNACYAASKGWKVTAFDLSTEGQRKAKTLAEKKHVSFDYLIMDAAKMNFALESFDVVALIYAHYPASIRSKIHQNLLSFLKKDGILFMEAFNKKQINKNSGGPKDITMLYNINLLEDDFTSLTITLNKEIEIILNEGNFHSGSSEIIRFIASKK